MDRPRWLHPRLCVVAALAAVLALGLAACSSGASGAPAAASGTAASGRATATVQPVAPVFPLTVTDSSGQPLAFDAPPKAIVSHSPGATEILFAIGAGSQVIAADEFSDYPPEAKNLGRVKYSDPDPEAELALQPDLVILATRQKTQIGAFRSLGLTVLYNQEPADLDGVLANITLLGRITGHAAEAQALVQSLRRRIDVVAAKVATVTQGPKVFYELDNTLYTAAPHTFIGAMFSTLQTRNIAEGATSPFPQLTTEAVIAANPDVILLADARYGTTAASVRARPGWAGIAAVQRGRVYAVDPDLVSRPGPRVVDGLESLARLLYPERFP